MNKTTHRVFNNILLKKIKSEEMQINRVKKNKDFTSIYNNSRKIYTRYTIIFIGKNKNKEQRFGFVASKKTGNAVKRNRIKRLFKEFVRNNIEKFDSDKDYIFVGKAILKDNIANLTYKDFEKDLKKGII